MNNRLIKSNDAGGGGGCTNTVDLYNPFPDGGGVALYQLNGDATDVSGNYNGTATNVTYGTGVFGQAGVFNGSRIEANNVTGFPSGNAARSVSVWVKMESAPITGAILMWGTSASNQAFVLYPNYTELTIATYGAPVYTGYNFTLNQWTHIVVTHDGTTTKVYADNVLVDSFTYTYNTATNSFVIGNVAWAEEPFHGSIDQVRIFSRALRPYEIEALYTEEYCTPTIVPSEHFNTVTYTGNGTTLPITGVGFQPDLVWLKRRDAGYPYTHKLIDSVRGATIRISSNETGGDITEINGLKSFDSDGFTLGGDGGYNINGAANVAWNFKAGGAAVTNTDGTITSQVSANTEAGFSIVSWNSGANGTRTIGHGLNDVPKIIITKDRNNTGNWLFWSTLFSNPANDYMYLNLTNAKNSITNAGSVITSTTFNVETGLDILANANAISYCFTEVEGFSSIGSYVGNGGVNTIVTGFEPAFMLFRAVDIAFPWELVDNKRPDGELNANNSDAERIENTPDFLENGFRLTTERYNNAGQKFIYMAFAADPTAVEPTLADSFNTVTYTGNGYPNSGTQTITNVGFQPDFTWFKSRNFSTYHLLYDSVRGVNKQLYTNTAGAEVTDNGTNVLEWTNTGFNLGSDSNGDGLNRLNSEMVAWNWKGAEIPAINSNGSIKSVVSANPAAGFSIVSYTGNNIAGATIGHGLGIEPDVIIVKNRDTTDIWTVQHSALTYTDYIDLSSTNAATTNTAVWYAQPTNEVFSFGANPRGNGSGNKIIAYCFAEVAGFSKFGSYTGTGASGNTVTVGFEPAFVMIKRTDATGGSWGMYDNKRGVGEPSKVLYANLSAAEYADNFHDINFVGNTFVLLDNSNNTNFSGATYIYMAFANQF